MMSRSVLLIFAVFYGTGTMGATGQKKYLEDSFSDFFGNPDLSIIPPTKTIPLYDCTDSHRPKYDNTKQYQVFHNDQWWTQACPEGLEWNQFKCRCGYADGSQPIAACRDYRQTSEGVDGKYEQYVNGKWIVRDCSLSVAGLVWDQTACQCVWGPDSSGKVTGQKITPCDLMLNMTFEDGVKDYAKGSFVEVGRGKPVSIEAVATKGKPENMAAYFTNTALNLWFFSNNELGSSLRLELTFKMEENHSTRDSYQMLVSNGCNVSMPGYTTPSVAIGYRPSDQSYLLAFETVTARKAIVCSQKLGAYDWHTVSLIYEDGTLLLRVDGRPCIMSQDFSGHVQKTSCPLTIGADPLERDSMYQGYMDNIIIARYCRRYVDKDNVDSSESLTDGSSKATYNNGPMLVEPASKVSGGGQHWSGSQNQERHRNWKTQLQQRQKRVEYVDEEDKQDNKDEMETGDSGSYNEDYDYDGKSGRSKSEDDYGDKDYYDEEEDEEEHREYEDKGKTNFNSNDNYEREKSSEKERFDQRAKFGRHEDIGGWKKSGGGEKWWEQKNEAVEENYDKKEESWRGFEGRDSGRIKKKTDGFDHGGRSGDKESDSWDGTWLEKHDDQEKKDETWSRQRKGGSGARQHYGRQTTNLDKRDNSRGEQMFRESSNEAKSTDYKEFSKDFYSEDNNEGQEYTDFTDYGDDYSKEEQSEVSESNENNKWKRDSKVYSDYDYEDQKTGDDYHDTYLTKERNIPDEGKTKVRKEDVDYSDYSSSMDDDGDGHSWEKHSSQREDAYDYHENEDNSEKLESWPTKTGHMDERRREFGHMRHGEWARVDGDKARGRMHDRRGKTISGRRSGLENDRMSSAKMSHRGRDFDNERAVSDNMGKPDKGGISSDDQRDGRRSREGHFLNRMVHDFRGSHGNRHPTSNLMDLPRKNPSKGDRAPAEHGPYNGKDYERRHQSQDRSAKDHSRKNRRGPGVRMEGRKRRTQRPKQSRPSGRGNAMNVHSSMVD